MSFSGGVLIHQSAALETGVRTGNGSLFDAPFDEGVGSVHVPSHRIPQNRCGLSPTVRGEALGMEDFAALADCLWGGHRRGLPDLTADDRGRHLGRRQEALRRHIKKNLRLRGEALGMEDFAALADCLWAALS